MRPYLAIIKDSFREAFASKVLWILLGLILLFLLALAPIGYRLNRAGEFTWGDISEGPLLVGKLRSAFDANKPSPARRIWSRLDDDTREKLRQLEAIDDLERGEGRRYFQGMDALREGLNKLLKERDLYDEGDWKGVPLPQEAKDLLARPRASLSETEVVRMNRLLVESSLRAHLHSRSDQTLSVTYFAFATDPLPFSKQQADSFIKEWVLTSAMSWIVGVFGMIAAILVTSSIIPQMFDPGSITLLLSKPISRSLLFTSKFLGGCAFILLSVSLLLGGLWLIVGVRFGIWNQGLLWCIPIFLFMFLIYYAVSALAGLIWKSAIISVVLTVTFWIACWSVDMAKLGLDVFIEPQRISKIAEADGALLVVNDAFEMKLWDDEKQEWRQVHRPNGPGIPSIDGPYYHVPSKQLLVGQGFRNPFGLGRQISLRTGRASDGWTLRDGPGLPSGTGVLLMTHDYEVIAITASSVHRLEGNPSAQGPAIRFLGMRLPLTGGGEFRRAISKELSLHEPLAAAADPQGPRLVIVAGNEVYLLAAQQGGKFVESASATLRGKEEEGSAVAIAGDLVLVAREDGILWLLSASDLSVQKELKLESKTQPRFVTASPDGSQFGVLFQNRTLWLVDAKTGTARRAPLASQGHISGFAFTPERLLASDYANRVVAYDGKSLRRDRVYRSAMSRAEIGYYYFVRPLHIAFPKPRYLDNTVQYVLTGKRTTDLGLFQGSLQQRRDDLNPWQPVASGLVFVGLVLLVSCIYIERQEF